MGIDKTKLKVGTKIRVFLYETKFIVNILAFDIDKKFLIFELSDTIFKYFHQGIDRTT